METIGEKIRRTIKEKKFKTLKAFYAKLKEIYGKSAINRSTLTRLLKNQVEVRERTLNQIAIILGVKTSYLREGTDAEVSAIKPTEAVFTFNDKASLKILTRGLPFNAEQVRLRAGGRTAEMQDDAATEGSYKWIYVLMGKVILVVKKPAGNETLTLHKSQYTYFDARQLHYLENVSRNTSLCLAIHFPAQKL